MPSVSASGIGQAGTVLADWDSRDGLHGPGSSHSECIAGYGTPAYTSGGAKTIPKCAYPGLASARGGAHIDILHSVVEPPIISPLLVTGQQFLVTSAMLSQSLSLAPAQCLPAAVRRYAGHVSGNISPSSRAWPSESLLCLG